VCNPKRHPAGAIPSFEKERIAQMRKKLIWLVAVVVIGGAFAGSAQAQVQATTSMSLQPRSNDVNPYNGKPGVQGLQAQTRQSNGGGNVGAVTPTRIPINPYNGRPGVQGFQGGGGGFSGQQPNYRGLGLPVNPYNGRPGVQFPGGQQVNWRAVGVPVNPYNGRPGYQFPGTQQVPWRGLGVPVNPYNGRPGFQIPRFNWRF